MLSTLLHRFQRSSRPARTALFVGAAVPICPPEIEAPSLRASFAHWWREAALGHADRSDLAARSVDTRLAATQREFVDALSGVPSWESAALCARLRRAGSMRELWHLRVEVFSLISLHQSQAEATDRLAWLNRRFPTRAPRSGFADLSSPKDSA